jgi:hypothetical protein
MVSGIPPVGVTQNERFFSYETVLLGVRNIKYYCAFGWYNDKVFYVQKYTEWKVSELLYSLHSRPNTGPTFIVNIIYGC